MTWEVPKGGYYELENGKIAYVYTLTSPGDKPVLGCTKDMALSWYKDGRINNSPGVVKDYDIKKALPLCGSFDYLGNKGPYEVGDYVLITKPKDITRPIVWSPSMDSHHGTKAYIEEVSHDGALYKMKGIGYTFFHSWLTKYTVPKKQPVKKRAPKASKKKSSKEYVPWTFATMADLVRVKRVSDDHLYMASPINEKYCTIGGNLFTFKQLLNGYVCIDGKRCGVKAKS